MSKHTLFKNDEEYYADTSHISSSMIKTYLQSPSLFKAKYVDKTFETKQSTALVQGSVVDCLVTEPDTFQSRFFVKKGKAKDPEGLGRQRITPDMYDSCDTIAEAVRRTDIYKWIVANDPVPQPVFTGEFMGHKTKGKLDWLIIKDDKAIIIDLKTTASLRPAKYHWTCQDFGYYIQMWWYRRLVQQAYPQLTVENYHLVVEKGTWPTCHLFKFTPEMLDAQLPLIEEAMQGIINQDFAETPVSFENMTVL